MKTPEGFRVLIPERAFICNACEKSWWTHDRPHACPPAWWCREEGEEPEAAHMIHADSAEDAACKYIESCDDGACGLTEETSVIACTPGGEETIWRVTGEVVREYRAEPCRRKH